MKRNHHNIEVLLREPIWRITHEYGADWQKENAQAKAALRDTLNLARKILPRCRKIFIGRNDFTLHDCDGFYLEQLLFLKHFLASGDYIQACEQLVDVLHYFHIEDRRILYQLIRLLEDYL